MSTLKNKEIEKIGERMRFFRKKKDLTLVQFANLIGITHSSLSSLENNKSKPSSETLSNLCLHTDINIEWLLTGKKKEEIAQLENHILTELKIWLNELRGKEPMTSSWFAVELKKKFPEFNDWLEKKRSTISIDTDREDNKIKIL
jgi:transcriptional regulator with XRE-family HTH domain